MTYSARRNRRSSRKPPILACSLRSSLVAAMTRRSSRIDSVPPSRRDGALFERSQQRFLPVPGQISDLVEKDRSAVGGDFEATVAARAGAGEGPFLVTEELAVDQGLHDGAAIDDDERVSRAPTVLMQGAGDDFLAGAGLPVNHHGIVGGDDGFDLIREPLNGGALSHDRGDRGPSARRGVNERSPRDGSLHGGDEMFLAKRLGDEIESALPGHADRRGNAAMGGDDDDRQVRIEQSQALQHFVAAEVGHAHVQQDRVRSAAGRHLETDPSRFGFGDFKPGVRQDVAHDPSHVPIVVDNEDNGLLGRQDGLRTGPETIRRAKRGFEPTGRLAPRRTAPLGPPGLGDRAAPEREADSISPSSATRAALTQP